MRRRSTPTTVWGAAVDAPAARTRGAPRDGDARSQAQRLHDGLRDRRVLDTDTRQVGHGNLARGLAARTSARGELAELGVYPVTRHHASGEGVVQVAVALRLKQAVHDELVGTREQGGLELDLLRAAGPGRRDVGAGRDPGRPDQRGRASGRGHDDTVVTHRAVERRGDARLDERRELARERLGAFRERFHTVIRSSGSWATMARAVSRAS